MKKILITGGSGFIGTCIIEQLLVRGYQVINLDQKNSPLSDNRLITHVIDTTDTIPTALMEGVHGVINLAGVPIFGRFTESYKKSIYDSRVLTTENIIHAIKKSPQVQVLVSASAIGYYGDTDGTCVSEGAPAGSDFLARICVDWEARAREAGPTVRTVILRTAHVIGRGGLAGVLVALFKNNIGGYFGTGNQHMPWVGADDIVNMYISALEHDTWRGTYNTAAANPTQREFMDTIRKTVGAWILWRIPSWAGRLRYGSFIDNLTIDTCVDAARIRGAGFIHTQTDLFTTLKKYYS